MRASLLLLLALAACAPSPPPSDARATDTQATPPRAGSFDAQAWLARARATPGNDIEGPTDPRVTEIRALTDELDAATGWNRACDSHWNPDTRQMIVEEDGAGSGRGLYSIIDVAADEAVVLVQCDFGANSGTDVYIHIVGGRAALLLGQSIETDGAFFGPPTATYASRSMFTPGSRSFEVLASSSAGSCGTTARYQIVSLGTAELIEARGQACGETGASADEWPIIYPRP